MLVTYHLKSGFQVILKPVIQCLVKRGMANQVTLAASVLVIFSGVLIVSRQHLIPVMLGWIGGTKRHWISSSQL